jgi:acetyl-CoA acetyltransferase
MAEVPILVGVGDIINRNLGVHHAAEPAELMLDAISIAFQDTGLSPQLIADLRINIDSIDVVRTWTWPYPDLPGLLAERLGAKPNHTYCSPHAGNQPAKLVDEAARRIAKGETKLAIVTGGEALASLAACAKAGVMPPPNWTPVEKPVTQVFAPSISEMAKGIGAKHTIGAPIQVYPLFENGLRAQRGQSLEDNNTESAKLYAEFAQVANKNPLAWSFPRTAETEDTIGRISNRNRMICSPCTASQTLHYTKLTSARPSSDECLQHSKSRRSSHPNIRLICPRIGHRTRTMDIRARRSRHTRQRQLLGTIQLPLQSCHQLHSRCWTRGMRTQQD